MGRLSRREPSLVVPGLDDERAAVVKGFEKFVGIGGDDAEALHNDLIFANLIVLFVPPFPAIPDAAEGEESLVRERNRPWFTDLFLLLVLRQRLPFVKEVSRDEAAAVFPWLAPGAARGELVSSRINRTEIGSGCFRPIGHETPLHDREHPVAGVMVEPHHRLPTFRGDVPGGREAGCVALVILFVEDIGVVSAKPLRNPLFICPAPIAATHSI